MGVTASIDASRALADYSIAIACITTRTTPDISTKSALSLCRTVVINYSVTMGNSNNGITITGGNDMTIGGDRGNGVVTEGSINSGNGVRRGRGGRDSYIRGVGREVSDGLGDISGGSGYT